MEEFLRARMSSYDREIMGVLGEEWILKASFHLESCFPKDSLLDHTLVRLLCVLFSTRPHSCLQSSAYHWRR